MPNYITEEDKVKVLERAKGSLSDIVALYTPLRKSGVSMIGKCPVCGHEKGLTVTDSKDVFMCFKCHGFKGNSAIAYLMKGQNLSYPEAVKTIADHYGILLSEPAPKTPIKPVAKESEKESFCARMLRESGLEKADLKVRCFKSEENATVAEMYSFFPGTIDAKGEINRNGDDAIIAYFDLDGNPVTYMRKDPRTKKESPAEYYRVRYQFPDDHKDKNGKPVKYRTPYGAGAKIYIPELIRRKFKAGDTIDRLYIQEGEKKAEKATKHGILSIAISGIQNLGEGGRLPEDVIRLVQTCNVREVCFMLDADCFDISTNLKINDPVERRPKGFFYAVRNFKEYFRTLKNRNIYVEIFFGYVLKNEAGDKGIDDLLTNSLKGKEADLLPDIERAVNEKRDSGQYVQVHKITSLTDHKIEEFWDLQSPQNFVQRHMDVLKNMPEFLFGKHRWRLDEDGKLESAQPLDFDEKYWRETKKQSRSGDEYSVWEFDYVNIMTFLQNRGFGRYRKLDGNFEYVRMDNNAVRTVETWEIKDFVVEFTKTIGEKPVLEMLYKGGAQYLGPYQLGNLEFIYPHFLTPSRDSQNFYFKSGYWKISADKIEKVGYETIDHNFWEDIRRTTDFEITKPLIRVDQTAEGWRYELTELGKKCHFLQFLENTSNFTWRKEQMIREGVRGVSISQEEKNENGIHMIAKLCAIGFLITDAKDKSVSRAVIGMDGKNSEVGSSNGRSGKSLLGELIRQVKVSAYINGKKGDMETDQFIWNDIKEKTKFVFIDDVRAGYKFESMFANLTGDWAVNYKGGGRCTFPHDISPKVYITTNHAINGDSSSFYDRQWRIAFSDYYNENHKPIHDFGCQFFQDWDFEQWNLLWNMLAMCVQMYYRYGVIESPQGRIQERMLRQSIGEDFLQWAEEYFSDDDHRNRPIPRKRIYEDFQPYIPYGEQRFYKANAFKKRIIDYCKYKGYLFNPHKYDNDGNPLFIDNDGRPITDDKSNGVEYFTIGDTEKTRTQLNGADLNISRLTQDA